MKAKISTAHFFFFTTRPFLFISSQTLGRKLSKMANLNTIDFSVAALFPTAFLFLREAQKAGK